MRQTVTCRPYNILSLTKGKGAAKAIEKESLSSLRLENKVLVFLAGRTRTKDKYRIVYSDHQRLELEKEFHYSRYITIRRKAELANSVGLSERQVRNRLSKEKNAKKRAREKTNNLVIS